MTVIKLCFTDITVEMASSRSDPVGEGNILIPDDDQLDRKLPTTSSEDKDSIYQGIYIKYCSKNTGSRNL